MMKLNRRILGFQSGDLLKNYNDIWNKVSNSAIEICKWFFKRICKFTAKYGFKQINYLT